MFLTNRQVPHYLQSRNLVSGKSLIDGDCRVLSKTHRNRNFKALNRSGGGFFIKQVAQPDAYSISFCKREAACYCLVDREPAFSKLATIMPRFVDYDRNRHILIQEYIADASNFSEMIRTQNEFKPQVGAAMGKSLATCHADTAWTLANYDQVRLFSRMTPWVLNFYIPGHNPFPNMTGGLHTVHSIITQDAMLMQTLRQLSSQWQYTSLIHGDMKWDNIMVQHPDKKEPKVTFIDWELVDVGDAAWDVAGILHNYLYAEILSSPLSKEPSFPQSLYTQPFEQKDYQPQLSEFWSHYCKNNSRLDNENMAEFKRRVINFTAARLIQTSFEFTNGLPQMPKSTGMMLELSRQLFSDPAHAIEKYLPEKSSHDTKKGKSNRGQNKSKNGSKK